MKNVEPSLVRIATNGISLNIVQAGPLDGRLVILLHGFPESSHGWRSQIGPLADAGFRVLAPDLRGYGASDKPRRVRSYRIDMLVDDVIGLIDASGREQAVVIGHDWGGVVAWRAIACHPARFERAVFLNAAHPLVMLREIRGNPRQLFKSWYVWLFQLPWLPEFLLSRHNFAWLVRAMSRSSRSGTFSAEDFARYRQGWSEPGALTAMVNWYRAAIRSKTHGESDELIQVPTLILWGKQDRYLVPGLARASYAQCESARIEWLPTATHWLQHEEPDLVSRLILEFLAQRIDSDQGHAGLRD